MFKKFKDMKVMVFCALCLSVLGIVCATVAMGVALNMKATEAVWDVRFGDLRVESNGTASSNIPSINVTGMSDFDVKLLRENDSVTYKFRVRNSGAVDAKVGMVSKIKPVCVDNGDYGNCGMVNYKLSYNDGTLINPGDVVKAGTSKELYLTVSYNGNNMASLNISDLDFMITFEQA